MDLPGEHAQEPVPLDPISHIHAKAAAKDARFVQMKTILLALDEAIAERREGAAPVQASINEYFAAIMTALEAEDQSHTLELLDLLAVLLPGCAPGVLRAKAAPALALLRRLLGANAGPDAPPAAVRKLLACLGHLLAAQEPSAKAWNAPVLLKALHVVLAFFNDKRPKVRKAAHAAALGALRGSPGAGAAVGAFCAAALAAATAREAAPALHLLAFLAPALPLLPAGARAEAAAAAAALPALGHALLTQHALGALAQAFAGGAQGPLPVPGGAAGARDLLNLQPDRTDRAGTRAFCSLVAAVTVSLHQTEPHNSGAFLGQAMQTLVLCCEVEDQSVISEAANGIKKILHKCVDDAMIEKYLKDPKQSSPLTSILSCLEQLVQYRYQKAWAKTLPALGLACRRAGPRAAAAGALAPLLRALGELRAALRAVPAAALPGAVEALEAAVGAAVEGAGAEPVLAALPLLAEGPAGGGGAAAAGEGDPRFDDKRVWLLVLLAKHVKASAVPTSLAFFDEAILRAAKLCDQQAKSDRVTPNEARLLRVRVVQLWELLPGFCAGRPGDVASHFGNLAPKLANALQDRNYPALCGVVCHSLQVLIGGARQRQEAAAAAAAAESGGGGPDAAAAAAAAADLAALGRTSQKFLPVLFGALDGWGYRDPAQAEAISLAVATYAGLAPRPFLNTLFKKVVQRLLQATGAAAAGGGGGGGGEEKTEKEATATKAAVLCALARSLVPSLDAEGVGLLVRAVRPLVRSDRDAALQKRAYKVLLAICEHSPASLLGPDKLDETMEVLATTLVSSHVATRAARLQCLTFLVAAFDVENNSAHKECLVALAGEVMLCLKDANAGARRAAYAALLALARANAGDVAGFAQVVLGGLAARTPHMRSAAVLALARLLYEFGPTDEKVGALAPALLGTVMLCLREKANETLKAAVAFCRVAVACAPAQDLDDEICVQMGAVSLENHWGTKKGYSVSLGCLEEKELKKKGQALDPMLPDILENLMGGQGRQAKFKFRAKIKLIITKLCRKLGFERVLECIPEGDQKLVNHIKKMHEREQRKKTEQREKYKQKMKHKKQKSFEAMMASDDEDSDDEEEEAPSIKQTAHKKKAKKGGDYMMRDVGQGDSDDEDAAIDLLDAAMVKNMKVTGAKKARGIMDVDSDNEEIKVNADGRLVIPEDSESEAEGEKPLHFLEDDSDDDNRRKKGGDKRKRGRDDDDGGGGAEKGATSSKNKQNQKSKKAKAAAAAAPGAKFRSEKAGGDVRRRGDALQPYAYLPLDGKMLSKKRSKGAKDQYRSVVEQGRNKSLKGLKKKKGGRR